MEQEVLKTFFFIQYKGNSAVHFVHYISKDEKFVHKILKILFLCENCCVLYKFF